MSHVSCGEWLCIYLFIGMYLHIHVFIALCAYMYINPLIFTCLHVFIDCDMCLYVWASLWALGTSPATFQL